MSRLVAQSPREWTPIRDPCAIATLDLTVEDVSKAFGWVWEEVEDQAEGG